MFEFVLVVRLMTGAPEVEIPVHDCRVGEEWIIQAYRWAERSGVPLEEGPKYGCYRADSPELVRVRQK